jgi:hypothetical protein
MAIPVTGYRRKKINVQFHCMGDSVWRKALVAELCGLVLLTAMAGKLWGRENRTKDKNTAEKAADKVGDKAEELGDQTKEGAKKVAQGAKSAGNEVKAKTKDVGDDVGDEDTRCKGRDGQGCKGPLARRTKDVSAKVDDKAEDVKDTTVKGTKVAAKKTKAVGTRGGG